MQQVGMTSPDPLMEDIARVQAESIANRLSLEDLLNCREIVSLLKLPEVPSNACLVKGVLEAQHKSIPLMDLRVKLGAADPRSCGPACALILDVHGTEVGLIVDLPTEA